MCATAFYIRLLTMTPMVPPATLIDEEASSTGGDMKLIRFVQPADKRFFTTTDVSDARKCLDNDRRQSLRETYCKLFRTHKNHLFDCPVCGTDVFVKEWHEHSCAPRGTGVCIWCWRRVWWSSKCPVWFKAQHQLPCAHQFFKTAGIFGPIEGGSTITLSGTPPQDAHPRATCSQPESGNPLDLTTVRFDLPESKFSEIAHIVESHVNRFQTSLLHELSDYVRRAKVQEAL